MFVISLFSYYKKVISPIISYNFKGIPRFEANRTIVYVGSITDNEFERLAIPHKAKQSAVGHSVSLGD